MALAASRGDQPMQTQEDRRDVRLDEVGCRKTRHRGNARVGWMFTLTAAAYNLVRLSKFLQCCAHARREAMGPHAFDKHAADSAVASLGDAAAPNSFTRRILGRNQTEKSHQLTWVVEAAHVADLGYRK
jgi:hypothetical protein